MASAVLASNAAPLGYQSRSNRFANGSRGRLYQKGPLAPTIIVRRPSTRLTATMRRI
jgi:hypothetical protein